MILAHKTKLNPTADQEAFFMQSCNAVICAYNWGLAEWKRQYEGGGKPSAFSLKKEFNAIKKTEYPWVTEVSGRCTEYGFSRLGKAFQNFFRRVKQGGDEVGYPKFKSYHFPRKSFYVANTEIKTNGHMVRLPKIGWVNMAETLRFHGKINSGVISTDGVDWFISISVDVPDVPIVNHNPPVGVDRGVKERAVCSDGYVAPNNKYTKQYEHKLAQLQRKLARQKKGSNGYKKTKKRISRLHKTIANSRSYDTHNATTHIARNASIICIEDLNVKGMVKNRKLSKAVSDSGMGEFARQLEYKSQLNGGYVVKIDRWFPSSKTCSVCGHVKDELKLSDRLYICESCGIIIDRDLNASINIRNEGLKLLESGK